MAILDAHYKDRLEEIDQAQRSRSQPGERDESDESEGSSEPTSDLAALLQASLTAARGRQIRQRRNRDEHEQGLLEEMEQLARLVVVPNTSEAAMLDHVSTLNTVLGNAHTSLIHGEIHEAEQSVFIAYALLDDLQFLDDEGVEVEDRAETPAEEPQVAPTARQRRTL